VWQRWLNSYPELQLLDLDVGTDREAKRRLGNLPLLAGMLMPHDEAVLRQCVLRLLEDDLAGASQIATQEAAAGCLLPDVHLLAGALLLSEGRVAEAAVVLRKCYMSEPLPGPALRRICPGLRLLLRLSPCLLLPLHPSAYSACMLYSVALWRSGEVAEALEVADDMGREWGLNDEVKLLAGQIELERGRDEAAIEILTTAEDTQHDAVELARCLYLAYAHYRREEYRSAARSLTAALRTVRQVNPHLHARARLLLAELFERNGLVLSALRESARVLPDEVPGDIAAGMLAREERWVTQLSYLKDSEIERLAGADDYQLYIPDITVPKGAYAPLATSRDPVKHLKPKEQSWLKRQAEERRIAEYRMAAARGETVRPEQKLPLSGAALDIRSRIAAAQKWWPARRQLLEEARPRERLARQEAAAVGHLRFDFCGAPMEEHYLLTGEKRANMLGVVSASISLVALALVLVRSCVY
jgi:tetratricopeptide (TPR) repeat protein